MGLLINLEAIDRSGKTTQANLITDALREQGYTVAHKAFPDRPRKGEPPSKLSHHTTGMLIEAYYQDRLPLFKRTDSLFRRGSLSDLEDDELTTRHHLFDPTAEQAQAI